MGEIWVGYGKDMALRQGHQLKNLQNLPFIQIKG